MVRKIVEKDGSSNSFKDGKPGKKQRNLFHNKYNYINSIQITECSMLESHTYYFMQMDGSARHSYIIQFILAMSVKF